MNNKKRKNDRNKYKEIANERKREKENEQRERESLKINIFNTIENFNN